MRIQSWGLVHRNTLPHSANYRKKINKSTGISSFPFNIHDPNSNPCLDFLGYLHLTIFQHSSNPDRPRCSLRKVALYVGIDQFRCIFGASGQFQHSASGIHIVVFQIPIVAAQIDNDKSANESKPNTVSNTGQQTQSGGNLPSLLLHCLIVRVQLDHRRSTFRIHAYQRVNDRDEHVHGHLVLFGVLNRARQFDVGLFDGRILDVVARLEEIHLPAKVYFFQFFRFLGKRQNRHVRFTLDYR